MTLVTVWMPSYNYVRFLPEAIDSILSQTHDELDVIVFDDGSTDGSYEMALEYAKRDDRVRVLHHPGRVNRGVAATVASALDASRGEYTCVLPADDVLAADSIERRVAALESDPTAAFVYGMVEMLREDGTRTGELVGIGQDELAARFGTGDPLIAILLYNYIPGHTVLIRREVLAASGGADPRLAYNDWELWVRLYAHGKGLFLGPPAVAGHRRHGASMSLTATPAVELKRRLDVLRVLDEKADSDRGRLREPRVRALIALERAWYEFLNAETVAASEALERAFRVDPHLARDVSYLLWWVGPHQYAGRAHWFQRTLLRSRGSAREIVAEGMRRQQFAYWFLAELERHAPASDVTSLRWGVISNELEGRSTWPQPRALTACALRAMREPLLLGETWFLKSLLCGAGVWRLALRARGLARSLQRETADRRWL
jgi:GT2 family glycosyltransferase